MSMFLLIKEMPPFVRFGLIVGPSGSGKTHAVREFCNKFPEGVLYYEIGEPDGFVQRLSEEINPFDLALSYFSEAYRHYHILPESQ